MTDVPVAHRVVRSGANVPCVGLALAGCPLMRGLGPIEVDAIASAAVIVPIEGRQPVFEEGEPSRGLWIVASGRVRMHHAMADGRCRVTSFRAPCFALEVASALDGRPYMATAMAVDDTTMLLLPSAQVREFSARCPAFSRNLVDALCLELRQRDIAATATSLRDARGRVGCALLQLAREFGRAAPDNAIRIDYRLTRQDIADRAGITIETAIRVLSALQHQGIIRTRAQITEITDMARLKVSAGCGSCQFDCSVFSPCRALAGSTRS